MPRRPVDESVPLYSWDGLSDQSTAGAFLVIPWWVELHGDRVLYSYRSSKSALRVDLKQVPLSERRDPAKMREMELPLLKLPNPRLLDSFMDLVDATDDQVVSYARRNGVLDLCEHGMPYTHNVGNMRWAEPRRAACSPLRFGRARAGRIFNMGVEPTKTWRAWARRARGLMSVAANLTTGRPGSQEQWNAVLDGRPPWRSREPGSDYRLSPHGQNVDSDRLHLCMYVNMWCQLVQVSPALGCYDGRTIVLRFGSASRRGGLFGMLGLQMMTRISSSRGMAICRACGKLYQPSRVPDPARHNFCLDCGREASMRLAKQKLVARKSEARQLHQQGATPSEIAARLGSSEATVRGWLGLGRGRAK